mmetsp:Transcript_13418/g.20713  ORF Transcript_13418/g.20713 Transcript_13418/m.20713 type:complete len:270 (-) Transcript_13418:155-964(-)
MSHFFAPSKTLKNTNYVKLYNSTEAPRLQFHVFSAVEELVETYAKQQSIPKAEVHTFIEALQNKTLSQGGVEELMGKLETVAIRLWTSSEMLRNRELCSIFNEAIRTDNASMMPSVVRFARGLNMLCVNCVSNADFEWPELTYRGGALPKKHHSFFVKGKQFRAPQFLSTSEDKSIANLFAQRAEADEQEPVLWEFYFDKEFHCVHVNLLKKSNVQGEQEFLFTAYSVFTVRSATFEDNPKWTKPHRICLDVAPDNRHYSEELPLSPWS